MRPHSGLIENAQLRVIAEWLNQASRWLEDEIQDNREQDLVEGGFRRSTVMLMTMTAPLADAKMVPAPTGAAPHSCPHLRLLK